jgi:hypothetical protein
MQKTNAPGVAGKTRQVTLIVTPTSFSIEADGEQQLNVKNETGFDITNEASYVCSDRQIATVDAHGLVRPAVNIEPPKYGSFDVFISDNAGGTARITGNVKVPLAKEDAPFATKQQTEDASKPQN